MVKRIFIAINLPDDIKNQLSFTNHKIMEKVPVFCKVPFTEVVVFADGSVSQCCNFIGRKSKFVDKILNKSLEEVWYGEKFENLRKEIIKGNWPDRCRECTLDFMTKREK